jgi:copper(I)-binding protein
MKYLFAVLSFFILVANLTNSSFGEQKIVLAGPLEISEARIFIPLKGSSATAAYAKLKNNSDQNLTLTLVNVEAFSASEIHESLVRDGKMSMKKIDQIIIAAHKSFEFSPGGHHIMLFDATQNILANQKLKVQFKINGKAQSFDFEALSRF